MKKFNLSMFAMAGLLFAACADKEIVEGGGQGDVLPEGYMSLSINLPTTPSTRAANDKFDDGDAKEYQVNNCALLLFEGNSESEAELIDTQKELRLKDKTGATTKPDNITESYKLTIKVNNYSGKKKLWALALLNYNNVLASIDTDGLPTFKTETGEKKLSARAKLSDIQEWTTKLDLLGDNKDHFFMTNAVLSKVPGGSMATTEKAPTKEDVFQLAELDPSKIFATAAEAEASPAGDILVERAVAKATLSLQTNFGNETGLAFTVDDVTWTLDNMEPATYIFRHRGGVTQKEVDLKYFGYSSEAFLKANNYPYNYRFVGHMPTKNNTPLGSDKNYYRSYWCVDPNYSNGEELNSYDHTSYGDKYKFTAATEDNPLYCYENTFDVEHQSYKNTTRAIIKVKLPDNANNFYTINGGQDRLTKEVAESRIMTYIIGKDEVQTAFKDQMNSVPNEDLESAEGFTIDADCFNPTYERNDVTGQYELTALVVTSKVSNNEGTDGTFKAGAANAINAKLEELIKDINDNFVVFAYTSGYMYYEARFMHFAAGNLAGEQDLAPWNDWEPDTKAPSGGSTTNAYPDLSAQNYLGRYGMVRNNWYDVEITSFSKLGYPEIPSVKIEHPGYDKPDTPDDNLKEYLSVKIHVLSWAKRRQGWFF